MKNEQNPDFQKIKLTHAYDGFEFNGWQKQKSSPLTVQGSLEQALEKLFSLKIKVVGAGRTDAGAHALGQVAHLNLPKKKILSQDTSKLLKALNTLTPKSLICLKASKVSNDFHAHMSPSRKLYKYLIYNNTPLFPFIHRYSLVNTSKMNLFLLNKLSKPLIGKKDFKSFQNQGSSIENTVREIYEAKWTQRTSDWIEFSISGSGFLKQMVRNIVGTQLDLMKKNLTETEMKTILSAKDRKKAGKTISPCGLYLVSVSYLKRYDEFKLNLS